MSDNILQYESKSLEYHPTHRNGPRLIARMKDTSNAFDDEEIYSGFGTHLQRASVRRNKAELGEFFIKKTRDLLHHLCDEFEKRV